MLTRQTALLLTSLLAATNAFAPTYRSATAFREGKALYATEEATAAEGGADDILNSPAFLKRKLDVLKEDLAKIDVDIEEAKATFEANKTEMGDKIDQLKLEVSQFNLTHA